MIPVVKSQILQFQFKGGRTYIHGTDMYNAVMEFLVGQCGILKDASLRMTIHNLVIKQCRLSCFESGENAGKPVDAKVEFTAESNGRKIKAYLQETGEDATGRYPYDEDALKAMCRMDPQEKSIVITGKSPHTPIETAVAMNKFLTAALPSDPKGKWYFTRLELNRLFREGDQHCLRLILVQNLQNKLTKSRIFVGDEFLGDIYFSLVKQT